MMQPAANGVPPPMAPLPLDQQQHQQLPPQYYQQQHPIPPPQPWMSIPPPQQQQQPMWNQPPPQMAPQQQFQMPQQQQQPQQYSALPQPTSADEIRTLWIGDLQFWMEETYLTNCFAHTQEVVSVKVIRNKQTGQSESYGFIEFATRATAEKVLQQFNGTLMPNTEQNYRLNWATLGSGEKRGDGGVDYTIFVGDLASDVTDYMLLETFRTTYPSIKNAKVVTDRLTGRSKGYGFVKFADETEQLRAMTEMNGMYCSTRAMRIGPATNKKNTDGQQQYPKGCQETLI